MAAIAVVVEGVVCPRRQQLHARRHVLSDVLDLRRVESDSQEPRPELIAIHKRLERLGCTELRPAKREQLVDMAGSGGIGDVSTPEQSTERMSNQVDATRVPQGGIGLAAIDRD